MSADQIETEGTGKGEKKKSSIIKFIILGVVIAVLAGGGYFAWAKFFQRKTENSSHAPPKKEEKTVFEMDTFLVNLADASGKRYLKVSMKLEVTGAQVVQELEGRSFELRDSILMLLSGKEFEDIASPSGKMGLKQEIMARFNKTLKSGQVKEVYFTDFIVQ